MASDRITHLAVVGSRTWPKSGALRKVLDTVLHDIMSGRKGRLVSGGAIGVDSFAEQAARHHGWGTLIFKPDYTRYASQAPLVRNGRIIAESDLVLAFWDGVSTGTGHSMGLAARMGRPTFWVKMDADQEEAAKTAQAVIERMEAGR